MSSSGDRRSSSNTPLRLSELDQSALTGDAKFTRAAHSIRAAPPIWGRTSARWRKPGTRCARRASRTSRTDRADQAGVTGHRAPERAIGVTRRRPAGTASEVHRHFHVDDCRRPAAPIYRSGNNPAVFQSAAGALHDLEQVLPNHALFPIRRFRGCNSDDRSPSAASHRIHASPRTSPSALNDLKPSNPRRVEPSATSNPIDPPQRARRYGNGNGSRLRGGGATCSRPSTAAFAGASS